MLSAAALNRALLRQQGQQATPEYGDAEW